MPQRSTLNPWLLPGLYLVGRLMLFLALTAEKISSFGDLIVYYDVARLEGWPYIHHWIEYPPLFPFFNEIFYQLAGTSQPVYLGFMTAFLGLCGAAALFFFQKIAMRLYGPEEGFHRSVILFSLLSTLTYAWEYYDPLPLALLLAGLSALLAGKEIPAGLSLGLGMLAKWFPGFALAAVLRSRPLHRALRVIAAALAPVALVLGALWAISPEMTTASLASQPNRSSWQTVWAYLDGNRTSGAFVYWDWRLDPQQAYAQRGNLPRIPAFLRTAVFALAGLFLFWKAENRGPRSLVAFTGITFAVFLLWSPGWSPQWVMYLLPLILLTLPVPTGLGIGLFLLGITLLEWPNFLSQYWFRGVFAVAGLRTLALAVLVFLWYRITRGKGEDGAVGQETSS